MEYLINGTVGLVIGIIVLIIEYRTKWFSRLRRNDELDVGPEYREKPEPNQIMAEIKALPPVQSEKASKNYEGLLVKWRVTYSFVTTRDWDGTTDLYFKYGSSHVQIVCNVDLEQYPIMKTLKQGHKMRVAGTIERVEFPFFIYLAPGAILKI